MFPYEMKDCIVIPQTATYEVQDKIYVYKVVDGKAESTFISLFPIDDGQNYVVKDGLKQGDVIIAKGAANVKEGMSINLKKSK